MDEIIKKEAVYLAAYSVLKRWYENGNISKAVFERLEKLASKANMTQEERAQYEEEWKIYNDYFNTLDFAEQKGRREGRQEVLIETARKFKEMGFTTEMIAKGTGLSKEEIEKL